VEDGSGSDEKIKGVSDPPLMDAPVAARGLRRDNSHCWCKKDCRHYHINCWWTMAYSALGCWT